MTDEPDTPGCTIKSVPARLLPKAAEIAVKINRLNMPVVNAHQDLGDEVQLDKGAISVVTSKYWGRGAREFTVSFLDTPSAALRKRIVSYLNGWQRCCGLRYVETGGVGQLRISRYLPGYFCYLGTDNLLIPRNQPNMNLGGFTMNTPDSECRRVIFHEVGHYQGFPHEHMRRELVARIVRENAYRLFRATQGWGQREVDQQVLTPLDEASIYGTPADQDSIMCYQLPGSITRDGRPIRGGSDINATDCRFAAEIYPPAGAAFACVEADYDPGDDWDDAGEDVVV